MRGTGPKTLGGQGERVPYFFPKDLRVETSLYELLLVASVYMSQRLHLHVTLLQTNSYLQF